MKKYLFICLLSSHLGSQEPSANDYVDDSLIVDGGKASNYDRPYSLNPIPINPRTPEPRSCDNQSTNKKNDEFEKEIQAYLAQDKIIPPPKHQILFIGSSILTNWKSLQKQMYPLPVMNRSFGGATTDQIIARTNQLILPYQPDIIVYYCGSNDISLQKKPEDISNNFKKFSELIAKELPETKIVFISINKAPIKQALWSEIDETNEEIKHYCERSKGRIYIDINPIFFDSDGEVNTDLFLSDNLHLRPQTYQDLSKIIKPLLDSMWKQNRASSEKIE